MDSNDRESPDRAPSEREPSDRTPSGRAPSEDPTGRQNRPARDASGGGQTPNAPSPGAPGGWIVWLALLGALVAALLFSYPSNKTEVPSWADFKQIVEQEGVVEESVVVRNDQIDAVLKPDFKYGEIKTETGKKLPVYVEIDEQNRDFYLERLDGLGVAWRDATGGDLWASVLLMWLKSAYHEAGHAVVQATLDDADPLEKVTIIPRGRALGGTFALPEKDRYSLGRKYLEATMRVACSGRIAEAEKTGDMSSGAADDIKRITAMARKMVLEWGMSERLGFVKYADEEERAAQLPMREQSDQTAAQGDEEVRRLVGEAYNDAERIVEQHWDAVTAVAEALLDRESLTADEVYGLVQAKTDEVRRSRSRETSVPRGI